MRMFMIGPRECHTTSASEVWLTDCLAEPGQPSRRFTVSHLDDRSVDRSIGRRWCEVSRQGATPDGLHLCISGLGSGDLLRAEDPFQAHKARSQSGFCEVVGWILKMAAAMIGDWFLCCAEPCWRLWRRRRRRRRLRGTKEEGRENGRGSACSGK